MGDHCTIEWVVALARKVNAIPASLNPIRGCSRLSEACRNCYAAGIAHRFGHAGNGIYAGLTNLDPKGVPRFNSTLRWIPDVLTVAINAKRSRVYFVCDMSDLFHGGVEQDWIDQVFAMMALCRHHHFLLLTKRPERMRGYLSDPETPRRVAAHADTLGRQSSRAADLHHAYGPGVEGDLPNWPLPNVSAGTTVEDQEAAAERIPHLLATPAVMRFLSVEPLLGPVDLTSIPYGEPIGNAPSYHDTLSARVWMPAGSWSGIGHTVGERCYVDLATGLDWVIAGGESGPGARPSHADWFRSIRDQCAAAGVPFLFKQWGEYLPVGQDLPGYGKVQGGTAVSPGRMKLHYGGTPDQAPKHAFAEWGVVATSTVDGRLTFRVGKKATGRLLDGVLHDACPEVP